MNLTEKEIKLLIRLLEMDGYYYWTEEGGEELLKKLKRGE